MSIPQSGGGPISSRDQLAEYLEAGCKPKDEWRIGTEHEKFGYCKDTLAPLPYGGERSIKALLEGLRDGQGWSPLEEGGNLIGLEKDGANVSLEPGGQFELSGAPLETIHETCDEVNAHLADVKAIADKVGVGADAWSGFGDTEPHVAERLCRRTLVEIKKLGHGITTRVGVVRRLRLVLRAPRGS